MKRILNSPAFLAFCVCAGLLAGWANIPFLFQVAEGISAIFVNLLKLVSLPIVFLSIVSTACNMESFSEVKVIGRKVLKYTLLTTILAASVALGVFLVIDPVRGQIIHSPEVSDVANGIAHTGYWGYLKSAIPSNFIEPFIENNVLGALLIAMSVSLAVLSLPQEHRATLKPFFSALYAILMKITGWILRLMPFAVFGFVCLFIKDMQEGQKATNILYYLACVVLANLIQAIVVLPLLLKARGVNVLKTFKAMVPALSVAFFSKSSSASLPMAMCCAKERCQLSEKVVHFTFPLCTTINMNGCAAFILTTVFFISMSYGMVYSPYEMVAWILIATIAAVGNAGVPMGCFFLASAFIAAMNLPLHLMGVILPFYALIDMLETAINVWSDSCVAAIVDQELSQEGNVEIASPSPSVGF